MFWLRRVDSFSGRIVSDGWDYFCGEIVKKKKGRG